MRLFSSMGFQMCPQIACLREHKITLVALMWLLSTMDYSNVPTNCLPARIQKHISYIYLAFFHFRLFKCAHKLLGGEDKKLHKLHLSGFSPLLVFKCTFKLPACGDTQQFIEQCRIHAKKRISRSLMQLGV